MIRKFGITAFIVLIAIGTIARGDEPERVIFNRDIRPIFSNHCVKCHGRDLRENGLRLDTENGARAKLESGRVAVAPHNTRKSELIRRVTSPNDDQRMPPSESGKGLNEHQIRLLTRWIDQGADWQNHWAYQAVTRPRLPRIVNAAWPRNEIDVFVLARIEREKLQSSAPAESVRLLRRVTLDLTGLPPTLDEVEAFLADTSPGAYERVVDRLLASPHFGERMAQHWLDLARYADTNGYHADNGRDMWRWRDWVIDAFNQNMPFDQFTTEQIAGDMLPAATISQRIASGFNRNHMINFEDGSIPEEFRNEYVVDRVITTATVWLGQTFTCVRCHDHKYDPFTQRDFYKFYAYFNNIPENGIDGRDGNSKPYVKAPTRLQQAKLDRLKINITESETRLAQRMRKMEPAQIAWERQLINDEQRAPAPPRDVRLHYRLDEIKEQKIRDASGKGHHARVKGNVTQIPRRVGHALLFDGEVLIEVSKPVTFRRTDPFSIVLLAFPTTRDRMSLVNCRDDNLLRGMDIQLQNGHVHVRLSNSGPKNSLAIRTRQPVRTNAWQQLVVTYDGSGTAAGVKVFFGKEPAATATIRDRLSDSINVDIPLRIGGGNEHGFRGMMDDIRLFARELSDTEVAILAGHDPVLDVVQRAKENRTKQQNEMLQRYFLETQDKVYGKLRSHRDALLRQKSILWRTVPTSMVMKEMQKPRRTFILERGDYRRKLKAVQPGTPEVLPPLPKGAPANRVGLARWLVDPKNPLTARVAVNRFWQIYFGSGIVRTSDDFGTRGEWPSHPQLLDWLATEFKQSGWDVKHVQRLIVTSATYRQSSRMTRELKQRDPDNRLLARGPRFQLAAEFIRDNALAISGLLDLRIRGESVFPYQPEGLWKEMSFSPNELTAQVYEQSRGADLYRRGIYTFLKRTVPPPSMEAFGAGGREVCTVQRSRPNTPFQPLVLLNDPTYVEAARALAQRMMIEGGLHPRERINYGFRLAVSRAPRKAEQGLLVAILNEQLRDFRDDCNAARRLLAVGEFVHNPNLNEVELAAWTIVAQMLLNMSETITRG